MKVRPKEKERTASRVWKRDGWGGGQMKEERKGRRAERVLSDFHSLGDMTGLAIQSGSPCHPLPETIFLLPHTHNNCTSVSSFPSPPISSLPATLWLSVQDYPSPTPKYHRSVKRYFQGPGSLAVTCWVSAQKAKALHTCRWDKIHTNTLTPELIRHWYSPQMQIEASAFHR